MDNTLLNKKFKNLYQQYAGIVYSRCLRFTNDQEYAKDLVHDIFLKIFVNYPRFKGNCNIYTWIYKITTNECINFIKKYNNKKVIRSNLSTDITDQRDQANRIEGNIIIKDLLKGFDITMQKIGILYFYEELNQEEIAQILNISRKTVGRKLKKIKERIKKIK